MNQIIIDVREEDEFAAEHIEHSINIPLSAFASLAPGILNQLRERQITFMCRSGARAGQAQAIACQLGFNDAHTYAVYEGGIVQWKKTGNEVVTGKLKAPLPLMRQVQLVVGALIITFSLLALLVDSRYALGALAVGGGLLLAGATGFCALATLMSRLPWNRADSLARREMCQMSKGG